MSHSLITKIQESIAIYLSNAGISEFPLEKIVIQKTKNEFEGDFTIVCFGFTSILKKNPDAIAQDLGIYLTQSISEISAFNVIKGFLNLSIAPSFWLNFINENSNNFNFGINNTAFKEKIVIEFSSPNTNKPLHLGHVRNNLLGHSVSEILKADGFEVKKVNLINDRGIHICKSMLAWQRWGNGETPETANIKGDHLIGKYYVLFDQHYKIQVNELIASGLSKEVAEKQAPLLLEAQDMLLKWEQNDPEVRAVWTRLNSWVYSGFDVTYKQMGINFDKIYYESDTYSLGKTLVASGLDKNVFYKKEDNSVWVDLVSNGLDEKLLLRGDGTSVYMTQDLGTASLRNDDFAPEKMIYVVGNEQNYHFEVLKLILQEKLKNQWAQGIHHLSYGMVELPSGKMKSREGTVVDADELMEEMIEEAKRQTTEKGKIDQFSDEEATALFKMIGLGALKYFILKVDPKKNMMFNPEQSIDLTGNTAPFIQYTHARICSLLQKASRLNIDTNLKKNETTTTDIIEIAELNILKQLFDFPQIVHEAASAYSPAVVANYVYELVKLYNSFYQEKQIIKEEDIAKQKLRLKISALVRITIKNCMNLLGIDVPDKM